MRTAFVAPAVGVVALVALVAPAGAASPAVVTVGEERVTRAQADHWIRIAARSTDRRRVPPRGTRAWRRLRDQALELLIQNLWIEAEAKARGVSVTGEQVRAAFRRQVRQSFPTDRDFRRFLRSSGFSRSDILYRVRLEQLSEALRKNVVGAVPAPAPEEVRRYYDENAGRFTRPERRTIRVLVTRTRSAALRARRALEGGVAFARVARRYSTERALRRSGGRTPPVARGQVEPALDRAVFEAANGTLNGPVRGRSGFYVFRVERIVPARTQPFEQASRVIAPLLAAEAEQLALDAFIAEYRRRWRPMTRCQPPYVMRDCADAPTG